MSPRAKPSGVAGSARPRFPAPRPPWHRTTAVPPMQGAEPSPPSPTPYSAHRAVRALGRSLSRELPLSLSARISLVFVFDCSSGYRVDLAYPSGFDRALVALPGCLYRNLDTAPDLPRDLFPTGLPDVLYVVRPRCRPQLAVRGGRTETPVPGPIPSKPSTGLSSDTSPRATNASSLPAAVSSAASVLLSAHASRLLESPVAGRLKKQAGGFRKMLPARGSRPRACRVEQLSPYLELVQWHAWDAGTQDKRCRRLTVVGKLSAVNCRRLTVGGQLSQISRTAPPGAGRCHRESASTADYPVSPTPSCALSRTSGSGLQPFHEA